MSSESLNLNSDYLYTTNVVVYSREFKGQSSGPQIATHTISSESKAHFCELLWTKVKPVIKAEILVSNDQFEWSTTELMPVDLKRYIKMLTDSHLLTSDTKNNYVFLSDLFCFRYQRKIMRLMNCLNKCLSIGKPLISPFMCMCIR